MSRSLSTRWGLFAIAVERSHGLLFGIDWSRTQNRWPRTTWVRVWMRLGPFAVRVTRVMKVEPAVVRTEPIGFELTDSLTGKSIGYYQSREQVDRVLAALLAQYGGSIDDYGVVAPSLM